MEKILNTEINRLDKEIVKRSNLYRELQQVFDVTWRDVHKELLPNEVAVEFICVQKDIFVDEYQYYALLLRSDSHQPEIIPLCSDVALKEALLQSVSLYPLVWQPLEAGLAGVDEVYIAPVGLLHMVSFPGIKIADGYLMDSYSIHNLLSTKDLISLKKSTMVVDAAKTAVLFGGADFDLSVAELEQSDKDLPITGSENLMRGQLDYMALNRGQGFQYLPGSKMEVDTIAVKLKNLDWNVDLFVDKYATESRFKSFSSTNSPELIHISTHGFYFPMVDMAAKQQAILSLQATTPEVVYKVSDNPLMRTGLAFSAANYTWKGKEITDATDDGVLTAYEVANMNLSNTKLIVLSACKTGLGDIVDSEGVYGLQRAFRLAGVQDMIVSLWEVDDKETIDLMTEFYEQWTVGSSLSQAFAQARKKQQSLYPDDPQKWAGFILIE
jgi:CHAT domain-containing protein